MSEIKAGDLVMVVRGVPCCGMLTGAEGKVFRVTSFFRGDAADYCPVCHRSRGELAAVGCPGHRPIDLARLKKLEGEPEPDSVEWPIERELEHVAK